MSIVQVRKSDKSGAEIAEGTGARVRVEYYDGERTAVRADLTDEETDRLIKEYGLYEVEPRPGRRGEKRVRLA